MKTVLEPLKWNFHRHLDLRFPYYVSLFWTEGADAVAIISPRTYADLTDLEIKLSTLLSIRSWASFSINSFCFSLEPDSLPSFSRNILGNCRRGNPKQFCRSRLRLSFIYKLDCETGSYSYWRNQIPHNLLTRSFHNYYHFFRFAIENKYVLFINIYLLPVLIIFLRYAVFSTKLPDFEVLLVFVVLFGFVIFNYPFILKF